MAYAFTIDLPDGNGGYLGFNLFVDTNAGEVAQGLIEAAEVIGNLMPPLLAAKEVAQRDMAKRFDSETDINDDPWEPLSSDWLDRKEKMGKDLRILHMDGDLAAAAPDGWEVFGASLVYDSSVLPTTDEGDNYGLINNFGYTRTRFDAESERALAASGFETTPVEVPARPFIGLSYEAQEEIAAVFASNLDRAVEVFERTGPTERTLGGLGESYYRSRPSEFHVNPSGLVQSRIRGRFGPSIGRLL